MYQGLKFVGIIPARGGSKGIPRKNIVHVAGKPLIQYTIDEALNAGYLDTVIVSTDCPEIADISVACGAEVPFLRPPHISSDEAKTIDVILHALQHLKEKGRSYDAVVLLQPTQPLRKSHHIDEAIKLFASGQCESVVSVCPVSEHPVLMRTIGPSGKLVSVLGGTSAVRRQDFLPVYKVNGVLYINRIDDDLNKNTSLNDNKMPYFMETQDSIDIDTPEDLEFFRSVVERTADFSDGRI
jgi:CMP-N,N'-diacetyllegionaminic acid synthase